MRILVINGPNMNLLGIREPKIYGRKSYQDLVDYIQQCAEKLQIYADCIQSNHEGVIVDAIQDAMGKYDGLVLNTAAYTHTSIAIPDAIKAVNLPAVEVHISDIRKREKFRQISYLTPVCLKNISGCGFEGYAMAMEFLKKHLEEK